MRVRVRARERVKPPCVHVLHKLAPRRVLLPPLFLLYHPLSFSPLLFSLAGPPPPRLTVFNSIQRRSRHHPRYGAQRGRGGVSRGQVRCEPAPNEAQRAPPVIFLKDLFSTGGRSGKRGRGTAGQRVLSTPRRDSSHEGGRKAALGAAAARKPLEPVLREFFYARPWFSSRGTCRREFSSRTRFISAKLSRISKIFRSTKAPRKYQENSLTGLRCTTKIMYVRLYKYTLESFLSFSPLLPISLTYFILIIYSHTTDYFFTR